MSKPREPSTSADSSSETGPSSPDSTPSETTGISLTKELTRVEEANLAFYEAFMARDIDKMSSLWARSPHVRCVHPGWELVVGWEDVRSSWQEILRSVRAVEFQLEDIHVEVAGRTAWVNLIAFVALDTDDGDQFQASVVTTNILENIDGQWLFVLHHSSNFVEEEVDDDEEDDGLDYDTSGGGPGPFGDVN